MTDDIHIQSDAMAIECPARPDSRIRIAPVVQMKATLFPPGQVRLLNGPFKEAQETDRAYLLRLNPDRLLAPLREVAGLPLLGKAYPGWDSCSGQAGHYLSACALMAGATGDTELSQRVDYVVRDMALIIKNSNGGIYCSESAKAWFDELVKGSVPIDDQNNPWRNSRPWYATHKFMAGLRDAWLLFGSESAREALVRAGEWCLSVTANLIEHQWQAMLGPSGSQGEFGGPHEVLADIYSITGDRRYLECAKKFRHAILMSQMEQGNMAALNGLHANSQIPKFIGYERIYQLTGEQNWHNAVLNFWNDVVANRSWSNGGNSQFEHFFTRTEFESKVLDIYGPETCNTYNMLKLTEQLYTLDPTERYLSYYEGALYNHILPSIAPNGGFVYYTSMRPGHYRTYSRAFDAMWCCVGTGMENPARYGRMIYAFAGDRLFVNLFIPSQLEWKKHGLTLHQQTHFPGIAATHLLLRLETSANFSLSIRYPMWATQGELRISVNGKSVKVTANPGQYVDIRRLWKDGDKIDVALPMRVTAKMLPESNKYAALFYGPILLATPLGTEGLVRDDFLGGDDDDDTTRIAMRALRLAKAPAIVGDLHDVSKTVTRISNRALSFKADELLSNRGLRLVPFYQIHFQRYAIYLPVMTREIYEARMEQYRSEQEMLRVLEDQTLDRVVVGDAVSEEAHHLSCQDSKKDHAIEPFMHWRDATGWFSYVLELPDSDPTVLWCTYWGSDIDRNFDVLVNGHIVASEQLAGECPYEYIHRAYALAQEVVQDKRQVTVRFQARENSLAGGLFDCRIVRL